MVYLLSFFIGGCFWFYFVFGMAKVPAGPLKAGRAVGRAGPELWL